MQLWAIVPELIVAGLCLALVSLAGWVRGRGRSAPALVLAGGLACALAATARMLTWAPISVFGGTYAVDPFATVFKLLILSGALVALALIREYFRGHEQEAEAPLALAFATLGAVGLASSADLTLVVLFLQLMSMAGYLLVAQERARPQALEATLKLFIFGAVALAIMAYGLTFLYGLTGSLDFRTIAASLAGADRIWVALALLLVLIGYGFEITMVPLHFWAPDVFAGATGPVAGFLAVVPKIAGLAALLRFLLRAVPGEAVRWPLWIAAAALLTMSLGNLAALRQDRLKRLLAYSSIAQAGYLLLGVAVAGRTPGAIAAVAYYLAAYLFMNLGAFAVVGQLERAVGTDEVAAVRGLGRRAPWPAAVLALCLLSLAGIPPLAGFAGKVLLLMEAVDGAMTWLAAVAAVNFTVALYYYVRIVAEMYLQRPEADATLPAAGPGFIVGYTIVAVGTFVLGVLPASPLAVLGAVSKILR